jgi:hypothetical protein
VVVQSIFWWPAVITLGLVICRPAEGAAQINPASEEHPLHELAFLKGSWTGVIDGTIGPATGQRQYRFIIRDRFLLMMHDRDPQERASPSDVHEEWSIFSFDAAREVIVLREFLVEGLVNTYACEIDAEQTRLTCESEAAEGSTGLTLKLLYEFVDFDHFNETFEIFGPDRALQVRMKGQWLRTGERG